MRRIPMPSPAVLAGRAWLLLALALFPPAATRGADCIEYADYLHSIADLDLGALTARDVAVSGHYAFACVSTGFTGLRVVDISNPAAPWIPASIPLPNASEGIAIAGNYAYVVADNSGLHVVDIANPLAPVLVGSVDTPSRAYGIAVSGHHAYVADYFSGLQVVDIANPAAPMIVGSVITPGNAFDVDVQGDYVYVADEHDGLQVVDVSNPSSPTIVGSLDTPGRVDDVAVAGSHAYLADHSSGLCVVDISNPHAPVSVGLFPSFNGSRVEVSGTHVYFGVNHPVAAKIMTIDVSNPASPTVVGNVSARGSTHGLVVAGDHVYRAYMWAPPNGSPFATLEIFDSSNPASPGIVGSVPIPDVGYGVAATDTHGFVASGNAGLQVVDLSEPNSPVIVASMDTPSFAEDVAVAGNYAYVADNDSGLLVVDIANPASPSIIGSANTPDAARGVAISGSHAYVADYEAGLQVIDISNPASPAIVGSVDVPGTARAVAMSGTYAYVAASSGLKVMDVSDPTAPLITGSVDIARGMDVAVSGNYAVLACFEDPGRLKIVDVSEPWAPAMVATFETPARAVGVAVSGTDVYVVDAWAGLQVVDITIPWDPELAGSITTPEIVYGVAVSDPAAHVYITIDDTFLIYPAQCPLATAVEVTSFEAVPGPGGILLRWSTASESDHLGFRVYRSLAREGEPGPSISGLIPPPGPYELLDARVNPGTTYFYRLEAVDRAGDSELYGPIEATAQAVPAEPAPVWTNHLAQSRPNPFRPETKPAEIHFTLAEPCAASLRVFDATGRQTRLLMEGTLDAGEHMKRWDGRNDAGQPVSSGIYFYRLDAGTFSEIRTLVTIR